MMNRKLIYGILLMVVVIMLGYQLVVLKYPLNITGDPFGVPPKGTSPNCGPEDRYKFDVKINSKEDFVYFLKTDEINRIVKLDNFKNIKKGMDYEDIKLYIKSAEPDWNKVLSEIKTENVGLKTIYVLNYSPYTCSGYTLKMTTNGHVSVYGCCGK